MNITAIIAAITALMGASVTWEQLLTVGISLVRAAAQLATDAGITDAEFQRRHGAAMRDLENRIEAMLERLRGEVKP